MGTVGCGLNRGGRAVRDTSTGFVTLEESMIRVRHTPWRRGVRLATKSDMEPFTRISVAEAREMIEAGSVQVIDSREPYEYAEAHIAGALNIPHMATLPRGGELATDRPVLFVCKSGQRSALAAEFASALGLSDLYNIEGGMLAWLAAGYDAETEN